MKKHIFLTACFALLTFAVWADEDIDPQNIGSEKITQPAKKTPFSFTTHGDYISPTKINKGCYKGDHFHYAESEVELGAVVYYCPTYTEGVRVSLGFSPTYLRWGNNPWFDQDRFYIASVNFTGFSKRIDRWFWRTQITANFDAEKWSCHYTSYDLLLWGRYECCPHIGIHFGFLAETGLKMDRIYPIIGFDWQISPKWKLNLVYPVNISLLYAVTPRWSIGAAGRFFNSRFRVHHEDYCHKPLIRYTNVGAEFIVKYDNDLTSANFHIGSTLGGNFRVANHNNNHAEHYYLDPSFYVGIEADVKF